jgi:hypothetical protein
MIFFSPLFIGYRLWWVILEKNSGQKTNGYRLNLEDIQYDYMENIRIHLSQFFRWKNVGLMEVIQAIEEAKTDNDIEGIYIK